MEVFNSRDVKLLYFIKTYEHMSKNKSIWAVKSSFIIRGYFEVHELLVICLGGV